MAQSMSRVGKCIDNGPMEEFFCTFKKRIKSSDIEESVLYRFSEANHLTAREREILRVLLMDKTNQEISEDLYISLGTAKTHVHNIFQKIGVVKRPQLLEVYAAYWDEQLNKEPEKETPSP